MIFIFMLFQKINNFLCNQRNQIVIPWITLLLVFLPISSAIAQAPSSILPDLSGFKLTFPIDENGNDYEGVSYSNRDNPLIKADEVDNLVGYTATGDYAPYFFVSGSEVVFRAHCAGALTSANSYPRCELRQTPAGTGDDDLWDMDDEQELNATFRATAVPDQKREVCMLQIKGADNIGGSSAKEPFRLEYRVDGNQGLHVVINESSSYGGGTVEDVMDYSLNQTIQARMYVNNRQVTIEINNLQVSGSRGQWDTTFTVNSSFDDYGYFKAGAYTQSSIWSDKNGVADEDPDAYGEVRFSALTLGATSTSCVASVPQNRTASVSGTSVTFSWTAIPNIDHYKVQHRPVGGSWTTSASIRNTSSYTVSGLSSGTTYEWRVRSKCLTTASSYTSGPNFTISGSGGSLPSPWSNSDVGNVASAGSATYSSGTFNLEGSGSDIWNSADEFHFVNQSVSGDVTVTARVNSVENTNVWAKAGVMVRESLANGSKHAMCVITPSKGASFQRRTATDGGSSHTTNAGHTAPYWVRIERSGDTFTSYRSSNGSSWTNMGSVTITMNSSVYVGLVTTSHDDGTLCSASFDNVTVSSGTSTLSCSNGNNLAEDETIVSYSDQENSTNGASNLNDGSASNRWSANGFPQNAVIDLGGAYSVDEINFMPYQDRPYQFLVEGSTTSATSGFSTMTNATGNSSGGSVINRSFSARPVRYVRLTITGVSGNVSTWSSVEEFEVICSGNSSRFAAEDIQPPVLTYSPNPFDQKGLFVQVPSEMESMTSIRAVDMLGRVVFEQHGLNPGDQVFILQQAQTGLYLLQWMTESNEILQTSKVLRQ